MMNEILLNDFYAFINIIVFSLLIFWINIFPRLWDPMDYTVHGILQARILEWVAFPFSRESSQPRDRTQISHIAGRFFTRWATRETQEYCSG